MSQVNVSKEKTRYCKGKKVEWDKNSEIKNTKFILRLTVFRTLLFADSS